MELIIPFDSQSESPLYEQIYQYIKDEIRSARLEAGSRLPSTRVCLLYTSFRLPK